MAIRPSGSFRRYIVPSPQPGPDDGELYERLRKNRFRPIDDEATAEPSSGWVATDSYGSSDFRPETIFLGRHLRLRIRIDQKRLPSNAVRVRMAEALADSGGRIARSARAKLKEQIEEDLLRRVIPSTTMLEVFWRPQEQSLLLSSTSVAAHDLFSNLFRTTFSSTPQAATPSPLAEHVGAPEVNLERLMRLSPLHVEQH